MAGPDAILNNIRLLAKAFGVDEDWKDARIKVVEDRRAADLETIEALSRALAARDEMIARMEKHAEMEEARIACRDLKIESLIAKEVRSDADLAKHRQMDGYFREEVARLHVENTRLLTDLAKAGRDSDRRCLEALDKIVPVRDETIARLSRENERLRSDLAKAGKALDEATRAVGTKIGEAPATDATGGGDGPMTTTDGDPGLYNYKARVVRVVDGDTFDADISLGFHASMTLRLRLLGVDSPEMNGLPKGAGKAAKDFATARLLGRDVVIRTEKSDSFGRWLARVTVDGVDFSTALIEGGFAVPYPAKTPVGATPTTTATTTDPGPFGIDTPGYSDRDREMFVLGYEFAEVSRDIRQVKARDIPACRILSSDRTIHEANLAALLKRAVAAGLDYRFLRSSDGWCHLRVSRRDA